MEMILLVSLDKMYKQNYLFLATKNLNSVTCSIASFECAARKMREKGVRRVQGRMFNACNVHGMYNCLPFKFVCLQFTMSYCFPLILAVRCALTSQPADSLRQRHTAHEDFSFRRLHLILILTFRTFEISIVQSNLKKKMFMPKCERSQPHWPACYAFPLWHWLLYAKCSRAASNCLQTFLSVCENSAAIYTFWHPTTPVTKGVRKEDPLSVTVCVCTSHTEICRSTHISVCVLMQGAC